MSENPLYSNMRKLITIIDQLKDIGIQQYIQLPRIAVIGTQSAGKSSLLESIVGLDFLPRGQGTVTRRPLELRLVHISPNQGEDFQPYAEFPLEGKERYYDFTKVTRKIIELTDKVAGTNKEIVDDPIIMTIYSPNCPDLTLVDLPGITRIHDHSKNIEKITKDMCRRYARDSRTIILCVIPANQDLATSDALQMAFQEDPQGTRTIGVITKIDIMDKGTNAKKMLMGEEIPLKLGYIGVKGRSQQDIFDDMKVSQAMQLEKEYFASHPVYSTIPPGFLGTEALTQKLSKILFGHIRNTLPEIYKEIQLKITQCEGRLHELGTPMPSTANEKMRMLWDMTTDFTEAFKNHLQGKYDPKRKTKLSDEVSGGARINLMYKDLYSDLLTGQPTKNLRDQDIYKAVVLHQGDSIPGFPSVDSFLSLITPLLKKLKDPAVELLGNVHMYLESVSEQLADKIFERFPDITGDIHECVSKALREAKESTRDLLEKVIESEQTYIFTNDIGYLMQRTSFVPGSNGPPGQPNASVDPEKLFIDEIRSRIDSYFAIVLRNIRDTVPKLIGTFLVRAIQDKLQFTLHNEINRNEAVLDALSEPAHIVAERETLHTVLDVLKKAKIALNKDLDLAPTFQDAIASQKSKEIQKSKEVQKSQGIQKSVVLEESKAMPNPAQTSIQPKEVGGFPSNFPRTQSEQGLNQVPIGGNMSNPFGQQKFSGNKNTLFGDLNVKISNNPELKTTSNPSQTSIQPKETGGFQPRPQPGQGVNQAPTGGNMNNPFGQKRSTQNFNNLFGNPDQGKNTR